MSMGGGGGPTESTVYNSQLPEWSEPAWMDLLGRGIAESAMPYAPYPGQRLQYFSPLEQEGMARFGEMGVSGSSAGMEAAGAGALSVLQNAPGYGYAAEIPWNSNYIAGQMEFGYNPETRDSRYGYGGWNSKGNYLAEEFDPSGQSYTAGQRDVQFRPGSLANANTIAKYMDPYYQNVVDIEKREAARQADMRHAQTGLEAAGMGSLGGYREALMRSETERNLGQLMGDIQTRGTQEAWRAGVQNFEADRAAKAQLEQFRQSQFGMNEQMRQRQAELMQQGYGMQEAARQAQAELYQQGYGLREGAKQAQEQFRQSQYGLNQQALQAAENMYQNWYNSQEANRQAQAQMGLASYQALEGNRQRQAELGLQQQQNQLAASGLLGDLSGQEQQMMIERIRNMMMAGGMERDLMQKGLDIGYQDFLRQQAYPREQLGLYANLLYGSPVSPGGYSQTYGSGPSDLQQMLGGGLGGLALYGLTQNGKGGQV